MVSRPTLTSEVSRPDMNPPKVITAAMPHTAGGIDLTPATVVLAVELALLAMPGDTT